MAADVQLDLQAALTNLYDALRYDLSLDYDRPPEIPLREAESGWAAELLHEWRAANSS